MTLTALGPLEGERRRGIARRKSPRLDVSFTALLKVRERVYAVQVINVSAEGAMVSCSAALEFDEEVQLGLEGQPPVSARVIWQDSDRFGIAFDLQDAALDRHIAWILAKKKELDPQPDRRRT